MASPHVAGEAALVRGAHAGWSSEEVKAAIMNTATQDVFVGANHTGDVYGPERVGSGRVKVADANFPGLRGLSEDFTLKEEWYSLKNFRQDNHVLLILETAGMHDPDYKRPPFPIAWARKEGKGRVYYNAMGHREDTWMSERFHKMPSGTVEARFVAGVNILAWTAAPAFTTRGHLQLNDTLRAKSAGHLAVEALGSLRHENSDTLF